MAMDIAALRAYQQAAQTGASAIGQPDPAQEANASSFTQMVAGAIENTNATLQQAEQMTASAATGQAELVDVVTAVAAAEVQLETVIAVRDQVIRAYNDILKMPI